MSALRVDTAHGGAQLRLILDRPKGNIVTSEMVCELRMALAIRRSGVKLITLEAAGPHFSYGASVEEHLPDRIGTVLPELNAAVVDLLNAQAPTIAVVRGRCLGGGFELVLACDLVFAADDAVLGVPEVGLGVFPPAAAALLPPRIGVSRAARAVLGGEALPASWWANAGLVDRVVPGDGLEREVEQWFSAHAAPRSAVALAHAAEASRGYLRRAVPEALAGLERQYLDRLMTSHDATEGIVAFMERRAPQWRDA